MILVIVIMIMMMSAIISRSMTGMRRSRCTMRRSHLAHVPLKTALVAVALFLVAVLILVGVDVNTIETSATLSNLATSK